jgi:hypothetical protein
MPARSRTSIPVSSVTSPRLGVTTVASGSSRVRSAATASGRSRGSPCLDAATGSTTRLGRANRSQASATVSMMGAEASIPVLAASTPMSVATDSICSNTARGSSS